MKMRLEIGNDRELIVREEAYSAGQGAPFSIAFLSDLHFKKDSGLIVKDILDHLESIQPSLILLGGDYIDREMGEVHFEHLIREMCRKWKVLAIAGNHDHFFGVTRIQNMIEQFNGIWIEKRSHEESINGVHVVVDGNAVIPRDKVNGIHILCSHKPRDINDHTRYNIILAGHLHGSQVVLWKKNDELYPGRLFYKWNGLRYRKDDTAMFVSRGISDTLPVRLNCEREIVVVRVE